MATTQIPLALTGPSLVQPELPGLAPAEGVTPSITVNSSLPTSTGANNDILHSQNPTATLQWTLTRDTTISWQANTNLVALVFGVRIIDADAGAPTEFPHYHGLTNPAGIFFTPPTTSTLFLSSYSWADNQDILPGSAFTYLVPPPAADDPNGENANWTLEVTSDNWRSIEQSGLAVSYANETHPALAMKYRAYCYTTGFGLWYVDPELDLCPQG